MSETAKKVRDLVYLRGGYYSRYSRLMRPGYYSPYDFSDDELKQVVECAFHNYEATLGEKWPADAIQRAADGVCQAHNAEPRPWSAAFTHMVLQNAIEAEEANLRAAARAAPSAS